MTPNSEISNCLIDDNCTLRNLESHIEHCALLELGATREHYSKIYGINCKSCLIDVPAFSLFDSGLPHDMMHDVFEGVVPVEIKQMLTEFISKGYFTYEYYCQQLVSFTYGYSDSDKSVPMTKRSYSNSDRLRLSSSQAMILVRVLPFR